MRPKSMYLDILPLNPQLPEYKLSRLNVAYFNGDDDDIGSDVGMGFDSGDMDDMDGYGEDDYGGYEIGMGYDYGYGPQDTSVGAGGSTMAGRQSAEYGAAQGMHSALSGMGAFGARAISGLAPQFGLPAAALSKAYSTFGQPSLSDYANQQSPSTGFTGGYLGGTTGGDPAQSGTVGEQGFDMAGEGLPTYEPTSALQAAISGQTTPGQFGGQYSGGGYAGGGPLGYQTAGTDDAMSFLNRMYGEQRADLSPYRAAGQAALGPMSELAGNVAGQDQLAAMGAIDPNINVDFEAIKGDPIYQFERQQAEEMMKRNLSKGLNSSAAAELLGDLGMRTAAGEVDRRYGREADLYGRKYGQARDQYEGTTALDSAMFDRFSRLGGMGLGAAGGNQLGYAQAYGNLATGLADAQASSSLARKAGDAQKEADRNAMYGNLAGSVLSNDSLWDAVGSWF